MIFWCIVATLAIVVAVRLYGGGLVVDGGGDSACPACGIFMVLFVAVTGAMYDFRHRRPKK